VPLPARESTPAADSADLIAGKYAVERVLGAGGMGIVYAARHVDLHELFAIKLMRVPEEGEAAAAAIERFLREARASARLRGEHVARVHDVGRLEDGTPYMVMEHLVGLDLRKLYKSRKGAIPIDEIAEYVIQACEAVSEAHAAGIIHRDLKPPNLFLTRRPNGTPCIKVLDFGISKNVGAGKGLEVTNTTDIVGSPFYMAPEQMRSGRSADPRSDIWSLGVVLYELAGGALPFHGDSITEVCARVLTDPPIPLASRAPGVAPAFEQIVLRCLEKEPENRFQTAGELAHALRAMRAGQVVPIATLPPPSAPASVPGADLAPRADMASSAAWGATGANVAVAPPSGSRLKIVAAVVACALAGVLGAAAFVTLRSEPEGTPPAAALAPSAAAADSTAAAVMVSPSASAGASASAGVSAGATPSSAPVPSASASTPARPGPRPAGAGTARPKIVDYGDRH
jgi:eukaryotic-like serine/threonine-protein kinase